MIFDEKFIDLFVNTTSEAAYASSLLKGKGNKIAADQAAVDKMRFHLNKIPMKGRIVIGEGEMDEAPMLYIGEILGTGGGDEVDIAVDPLEGTNLTAKNLPNALSVLAVSKKDNLLNAPDTYMDKIAVGKNVPKGVIDLDNSVKKNILNLADHKKTSPTKLTACLLERERHNNIIADLKALGVKIKFISDGDVTGAIYAGLPEFNVDIYLGIGGAPEGVLAAAALKCLGGQFQARLILNNEDEIKKAKKLGIKDLNRKYDTDDLVKDDVFFCASGVTDGDLVKGIKILDNTYYEAQTLVLHYNSKMNKKVTNIYSL